MDELELILLNNLAENPQLLPAEGRDFLEGVATGMMIMAEKMKKSA